MGTKTLDLEPQSLATRPPCSLLLTVSFLAIESLENPRAEVRQHLRAVSFGVLGIGVDGSSPLLLVPIG